MAPPKIASLSLTIVLASLAAATGAYLQLFLDVSLDGTTYEDAPSATNPATPTAIPTIARSSGSNCLVQSLRMNPSNSGLSFTTSSGRSSRAPATAKAS